MYIKIYQNVFIETKQYVPKHGTVFGFGITFYMFWIFVLFGDVLVLHFYHKNEFCKSCFPLSAKCKMTA